MVKVKSCFAAASPLSTGRRVGCENKW